MEQRRLRLGDILDDYCPRERRLTNHAVVAMIEEDVKQTRCTTCDAEHAYKGGKVPRAARRKRPRRSTRKCLPAMPRPRARHALRSCAVHATAQPPMRRPCGRADRSRVSVAPEPLPSIRRRRRRRATMPRSRSPRTSREPAATRRRSNRRRPGASAADSRAAAADRRAEGRAPAAGVHDPSAQRQRPFRGGDSADEAASARRPAATATPAMAATATARTAARASQGRVLPAPVAAASRARRPAAVPAGQERPGGGRQASAPAERREPLDPRQRADGPSPESQTESRSASTCSCRP